MAPINLFNLLAVSALAIFASSFGPSSVNALATGDHVVRDISHAHHALAKKKRHASSNPKRCKNKPKPTASSSTPKATGSASSSNNNNYNNNKNGNKNGNKNSNKNGNKSGSKSGSKSTPSSASPKPSSTSTGSSSSSGGGVSSKVGLAWPNGNDPSLKNFNTGKKPP